MRPAASCLHRNPLLPPAPKRVSALGGPNTLTMRLSRNFLLRKEVESPNLLAVARQKPKTSVYPLAVGIAPPYSAPYACTNGPARVLPSVMGVVQ